MVKIKEQGNPLLTVGDSIGIIAPSGPFKKIRLAPAIKYFEAIGLKVKFGKFIYRSDRYLAGSAKDRSIDLHQMFKSKSVKAIFSARGGYGSTQMLPLINFKLIQENLKPFFGFSDTTALQIPLWEKAHLPTISGLSLCSDFTTKGIPKLTKDSIQKTIETSSFDSFQLKSDLHQKELKGILMGGCLTLIVALFGTEYQVNLKNKILFLEDVKEEPYHVDRMLVQLSQQKEFKHLKAIIFGNFHECLAENPQHGKIEFVLKKFAKSISIPVFYNLPYGHQAERCLIPIGINATITKDSKLIIKDFIL